MTSRSGPPLSWFFAAPKWAAAPPVSPLQQSAAWGEGANGGQPSFELELPKAQPPVHRPYNEMMARGQMAPPSAAAVPTELMGRSIGGGMGAAPGAYAAFGHLADRGVDQGLGQLANAPAKIAPTPTISEQELQANPPGQPPVVGAEPISDLTQVPGPPPGVVLPHNVRLGTLAGMRDQLPVR